MASALNSSGQSAFFDHAYFTQTPQWTPIATTTIVILLAILTLRGALKDKESHLPSYGTGTKKERIARYLSNGRDIYKGGYEKYRDEAFVIPLPSDQSRIIVPPKFLPELNKLPDEVLSFDEFSKDVVIYKYVLKEPGAKRGILDWLKPAPTEHQTALQKARQPSLRKTIKGPLTQALPRLGPVVFGDITEEITAAFPQSTEWSELSIVFGPILARALGRVLMGEELRHHPAWVKFSSQYQRSLVIASTLVKTVHPLLRRFKCHKMPEVQECFQLHEDCRLVTADAIAERRKIAKGELPNVDRKDDMIQYTFDHMGETEFKDDESLATLALAASMTAVTTTKDTLLNAVYDLVARPELITMLREEVQEALDSTGGEFTNSTFRRMEKMDSFFRESARNDPFNGVSFQRKVMQTFSLSNGQVIPKGSFIETPWYAVASDPDIFPEPEKFDALRFYKPKTWPGGGPPQFASPSTVNLTFGYGTHACPGRIFAVQIVKMMLTRILLDYDIALPDGLEGRYPNFKAAQMSVPDYSRKIKIRRREAAP